MPVPDQPSSSEALFTVLSLCIQLLPIVRKKHVYFVSRVRTKIRNAMFKELGKMHLPGPFLRSRGYYRLPAN